MASISRTLISFNLNNLLMMMVIIIAMGIKKHSSSKKLIPFTRLKNDVDDYKLIIKHTVSDRELEHN